MSIATKSQTSPQADEPSPDPKTRQSIPCIWKRTPHDPFAISTAKNVGRSTMHICNDANNTKREPRRGWQATTDAAQSAPVIGPRPTTGRNMAGSPRHQPHATPPSLLPFSLSLFPPPSPIYEVDWLEARFAPESPPTRGRLVGIKASDRSPKAHCAYPVRMNSPPFLFQLGSPNFANPGRFPMREGHYATPQLPPRNQPLGNLST